MSSYNYFANVYDELTNNVEYEERAEYICGLLNENEIFGGKLLDLACGTGSMSVLMQKKGFEVTGIDLSNEMLAIASSKSNNSISLIKCDMTDFALPYTVSACICCLDSINHLVDINQVADTFKCIYNAMNVDGIFIFDVNTEYKHNNILADNSFVFDTENYFLSWDNELFDNSIVKIIIDIFVFNGISYDRYSEDFFEKAYSIDELKSALEPYFDVLNIYDELSCDEPKNTSERLYFVCKRKK